MTRAPCQLELVIRTWGGRRRGAGRKPAPERPSPAHRRRAPHDPRCPAHVTLRARPACLRCGAPLFAGSTRLRRGLPRLFPPPSVHRPIRSSPSAGGGGHADEARARRAGPRGTRPRSDQPRAAPARKRVGRALPCPRAEDAAGGPKRARVRPPELQEASRGAGLDPRSSAAWFAGWRTIVAPPPRLRPWSRLDWRRGSAGGGTAFSTSGRCRGARERIAGRDGRTMP